MSIAFTPSSNPEKTIPASPGSSEGPASSNPQAFPAKTLQLSPTLKSPSPAEVALLKARATAQQLDRAVTDIFLERNKGSRADPEKLSALEAERTIALQQLDNFLNGDVSVYSEQQLAVVRYAFLRGSQTLTPNTLSAAEIEAHSKVYAEFYRDILVRFSINSGSDIGTDSSGNLFIKDPSDLFFRLSALNPQTREIRPKVDILYPVQSRTDRDASWSGWDGVTGENWADAQLFAVAAGYAPSTNISSMPPEPLPKYIQQVPGSNPATYVVVIDPNPITNMLLYLEPYKTQTTPLTAAQSAWIFQGMQDIESAGQRLQYPYLPDGNPNAQPGSAEDVSVFGLMSGFSHTVTEEYLKPTQQATQIYTAFFSAFTDQVSSKIAGFTAPAKTNQNDGVKSDNQANYIWLDIGRLYKTIHSLLRQYCDPVQCPQTAGFYPQSILYPQQNTQGVATGVSLEKAQQWAQSLGLNPKQASVGQEGSCIVLLPNTSPEQYIVTVDLSPVTSMMTSIEGLKNAKGVSFSEAMQGKTPEEVSASGFNMLLSSYNAWNTGFQAQLGNMQNFLQTSGQQAQNALSTQQNIIQQLSSLITSLIQSLQQTIQNIG